VPKAKIHIRRIQNITSRYTKHKVYIDGFMVGSLKCGEAKWFDINDEGIMQIMIREQGLNSNGVEFSVIQGNEYFFECGRYRAGAGLRLNYLGTLRFEKVLLF
jgi:hypothetical protein